MAAVANGASQAGGFRRGGDLPRSPLGHKILFFVLACLAFSLFAPAIVLPVLRDYGDLVAEERSLAERVAELEGELRHRGDLAKAFAHDVVINERLAILDLHYTRPGEVVLPVLPANYTAAAPRPAEALPPERTLTLPPHWPQWAGAAQQWADEKGLVGVFLDPTLRPILLLMSAGLAIAAFVLFAPRPDNQPTHPRREGAANQTALTQPTA